MNEEYKKLIEELTKAGASDEEITAILEQKIRADKEKLSQQSIPIQPTEQPQESGFMGAIQQLYESATTEADPNVPKPIDPLTNAIKRGGNLAEQSRILTPGGEAPDEEGLARIAEIQQEQTALPSSQAYAKFNSAKSFGEALSALVENPALIITEITAESMSGLIQGGWDKVATRAAQGGATGAAAGSFVVPGLGTAAGLAGGVGSGAVVGMAETSLGLEYTGAFLESLEEAGVDTGSKQALAKAFADDNIISEARQHALRKGIPIAIFDLISGGVAGRIVTKPAKSLLGKIGQGAAELGVQAGLGAAGETAGQVVAGEELNAPAILSEAIGELGTAPVEIGIGAATYNRNRATDPAIADAERIVDEESDPLALEQEADIDAEYKAIAAKFDELDIEVKNVEEDMTSDIEAFSVTAEESELPDKEYTPQEAARIQRSGPMPSSQEQELNLDDSEATPGIEAAEEWRKHESDRQEFEANYTSEELDQMSEEDYFLRNKAGRAAKETYLNTQEREARKQEEYAKKQAERAKKLEEKAAARAEKVAIKDKAKSVPIRKKLIHGTNNDDIIFDKGTVFYATNDEQFAGTYGENLIPVEVSLNNPYDLTNSGDGKILDENGVPYKDDKGIEYTINYIDENVKSKLQARGFDGIVMGDQSVVAFDPSQVKSLKSPEKRVRVKKVDPEEEVEYRTIKYETQLTNILRDKPNKQLKRLQVLNENTLDLPEVNKKVQKALERLKAVHDEKEFTKQIKKLTPSEKLKLIRDRVGDEASMEAMSLRDIDKINERLIDSKTGLGDKITPEEAAKKLSELEITKEDLEAGTTLTSQEKDEVNTILDKVSKELKDIAKPALEAKAKQEAEQAKKRSEKEKQKDEFLTKVAVAVELNNPVAIQENIKAYREWRAKENLTEIDDTAVLKHASAEYYKNVAKARARKESRAAAAKQQKEEQEARKKAAEEAAKDIKKELGLSDDAEINPIFGFGERIQFPEGVKEMGFTNPKKISLDSLYKLISEAYGSDLYLQSLKSLIKLAQQIANKQYKNGIEFYVSDITNYAGISAYDLNKHVIVIGKEMDGTTVGHEFIHSIVASLIHSILQTKYKNTFYGMAKSEFYTKARDIYAKATVEFDNNLITIRRKFTDGINLTTKESNILTALNVYLESRGRDESKVFPGLNAADKIQMLRQDLNSRSGTIYGFSNTDEMLAETFSNPAFMALMGLLEAKEAAPVIQGKSYFAHIVSAFVEFMQAVLGKVGFKPSTHSYLAHITAYMAKMEQTFLTENPPRIDQVDVDKITISKGYRADGFKAQEFSAYNAMVAPGPNKRNKLTPELQKLLKQLANRWWKNEDIQGTDAIMRELNRINQHTQKNKFTDVHANYIWAKIQRYRQDLADTREIQRNAADYIRTRRIVNPDGSESPNEYNTSKIFKKTVDDFANVDIDAIDNHNRIIIFQKGLIDLAMDAIPDQKAYNIVTTDIARKKLISLLPMAGRFSKNPGLYLPRKLSIKYLANPATFVSILARYNKEAAQTLFNEIYGTMLEARTNTQLESGAFTEKLFELYKKHNMTNSDFVRAGMYGAIFSTQLPISHSEYWNEVRENAQTVLENAQNKKQALKDELTDEKKSVVEEELKIAQELFNTVSRATSMEGILTRKQQMLYDEFRNFAKRYENDIKRNTEGVWGNVTKKKVVLKNGKVKWLKEPPTWQHNYFPTFAIGRTDIGTHPKNDPNNIIPNFAEASNLWEAVQKPNQYGKVISHQAGFTKKKVKPKGYFYDYNLLSIAHKFGPSVLFDLYATRELKALNQLLNGIQTQTGTSALQVDKQKLRDVMSAKASQALAMQIKSIVGNTVITDGEINRYMKGILAARNTVATAMIATTGQFLVQTSSAYPAALIMNPKGFSKAIKVMALGEREHGTFRNLKEFIEKNGMSIQLRDVLFERFLTIEDVQKAGLAKGFLRFREKVDAFNSYVLRKADKHAARLVWLSAYFQAGGTLENPSKSAILAAERSVGLLQNMSDVAFSAPIFRSNSSAVRILVHMFYAFSSFALNAALNTLYSAKYSVLTNNIEARQLFLTSLIMTGSYQIVTEYLINPAYEQASAYIFGDDDDDEKEEVNYTRAEKVITNSIYDLVLGNLAPELIDNATKLAMVKYLEARAKEEGEEFDQYKDFPLWAPATGKDIMARAMGQYGTMTLAIGELTMAGAGALDALINDEEITEEEFLFLGMQNFAMLSKYFPLRGDVQKLLRKYEARLKEQERLAKKKGGGSPDLESVGTEFEFNEYEFNTPSDPTDLPEFE